MIITRAHLKVKYLKGYGNLIVKQTLPIFHYILAIRNFFNESHFPYVLWKTFTGPTKKLSLQC